jgi:hypothetical protein
MSNYFLRAWGVCTIALLLTLGYEALYPHIPALAPFESSHFWTDYNSPAQDSVSLDIDSSMFAQATTDSMTIGSDSLSVDSLQGSIDNLVLTHEDSLALAELETYTGVEHLSDFFKKLQELRQGKRKRVRIAYFGDSTTEGDLIVGDLRDMLQRIFGGRGVGFVSVAPHGTSFRRSIKHWTSGNWEMVNYFRKVKDPAFQFGISGDYGTASGRSLNRAHRLSFKPATGSFFEKVFLFYGRGKGGENQNFVNVHSSINGVDTSNYILNGTNLVNRISLTEKNSTQIDLAFEFPEAFPIYGLSFESETGLIIDNFAKRSDSGSHFGRIPSEVLKEFYDYLGCDLVVLHFGANVLHNHTDYSFYESIVINTVRHFQQAMGNVPVLIVGSSDRIAKIKGKERTTPAVHGLIKSQKTAAAKTRSSFLDLFEKMGGEGAMLRWANSNPPKAAPDYVHFSGQGAYEIAKIVFNYITDGYEAQTNEQIKAPKPGLMGNVLKEHLEKIAGK